MTDENENVQREAVEWTPPAADASAASEEIENLSQALAEKTREAAEAHDKYLRTYADFENFRKRKQREFDEFRKYANEQIFFEILTVVDHLGLALKHAAESGETGDGLREGVELVYKQLRDVLEKFGVKAFSAEGELFDPVRHDAVMQTVSEDAPDNTVAQVLTEGYMYHDKVLRHAKVSVTRKPAEDETAI